MPRSEFALPRRQRIGFLNREAQIDLIRSHTALVRSDPSHLRVIEVVGMGGVGKTRLLAELSSEAYDVGARQILVWINLGAAVSISEIGAMKAMREQVAIDCLLFDAALLSYWTATGQPFAARQHAGVGSGFAFRSMDAGSVVAGVPLPLSFARDVYHAAGRWAARRRYAKEEFAEIDELRQAPDQILRRLPHYLAIDLARELSLSGYAFLGFYDAYEKQPVDVLQHRARWLREFIGTLDRGLHVIATRESLGWDEEDWAHVVETSTIGTLPESECRAMVRSVLGVLERPLEDALIEASGLVPFFLEAGIESYQALKEATAVVELGDLPATPSESVAHLLDHLPQAERHFAIALASVQLFDSDLADRIARDLGLAVSVSRVGELTQSFFVEAVGNDLHRCHDLLTDFVRSSQDHHRLRSAALRVATDYLDTETHLGLEVTPERLFRLFSSVADGWMEVESPPSSSLERLIDVGYRFYDGGYWNEIAAMANGLFATCSTPAAIGIRLLAALSIRRAEGVDSALQRLEEIEPAVGVLGRHAESFRLEVAYLSELAGNYSKARNEFQVLHDDAVPFDAGNRNHVRSRLYHADMMMMDGRLLDSSRLLLETYETFDVGTRFAWAEMVRQRGHALRFSFLLGQAEQLYNQALRATSAPSLGGRVQTNLAETLCWIEPRRALEAAATAIEVNSRLNNRVEVAKCDAARALAFAKLGEHEAALSAVTRATQQARDIGYRAGIAIALQARSVVEAYAGDDDAARASRARLADAIGHLGTYGHLLAAPTWLGDYAEFLRVAGDVQWVEPDGIEGRLAAVLDRRSRR